MEIPSPTSNDKNYIRDFCTILRDNYTAICWHGDPDHRHASPELLSFVSKLYRFASSACPPNIKRKEDWDYLRFKIYLYLSTFDFPEDRIPPISLQTQCGYLLSSILVHYSLRKDNKIFSADLVEIFNSILNSIINRRTEVSLYSLSSSYYTKSLQLLVYESLSPEEAKRLFISSLNQFIDKKNLSLTDSDFNFYYEIAHVLVQKNFYPQELFTFIEYVFESYQQYPIQIILHLFFVWRTLLSKIKASPQMEKEKGGNPSQILYNIGLMKVHDLSRSFPWHISFQFFESLSLAPVYQFRVFTFINTISYSIKRFDITNKIDYLAKPFLHVMKSMFIKSEEKQHYLYYFYANVFSTISSAIVSLNKLKGIQLRHSSSPFVSFGNQQVEKFRALEIDYDLYTRFDLRAFDSIEEEFQYFDRYKRTIEAISKRIHCSIKFNLFEPFESFDLLDLDTTPYSKETTSILFYFRRLINVWLKFVICFSFRLTMMNYYALQGDGLLRIRGASPNIRRQYDYRLIHRHFRTYLVKIIGSVSDQTPIIQLIVDQLFSVLIYANKRQILTYHVISAFFDPLCEEKPIVKYRLEQKMIHFLVSNLHLLTTTDNKESNFLNQWILLLFRIGMKPGVADHNLYSLLRTNQRLIASNISLYMKYIANATDTLKSLDWYRKILSLNKGDQDPDPLEKELIRIRRHILDEIPLSSYNYALYLMFDRSMTSLTQTNLVQLNLFLSTAFGTEDPNLISLALKSMLPIFQKDIIDNSTDNDYDKYQMLFSSLFHAIFHAYPEDSLQIIKLLPYTFSYYQKAKGNPNITTSYIIIESLGVRINDLFSSISKCLHDNEVEAAHLFYLQVHCFNIVKERFLMNQSEYSDTITPLLYSIIGLLKFKSLKGQVSDFLYKQNVEFATFMVKTHNPCYFMTLYGVIGVSRSCISEILIDVMHNFLSLVKEMEIDDSVILEILNEVLSCSKSVNSHFNILLGVSMIHKYFHHLFDLNIIHHLLSITSGNIQHDMRYLPLIKKFLKSFLADASYETKKQFLQIIYDRIHLIWFGYRFMLIKIVISFNIKFPFKNYDQILSINKDDIFFMRIMLVIACGIESTEEHLISKDMKLRIKDILKRIIDNTHTQRSLEPKVIASIAFYSILFNDEARNLFFADPEYVNMILFFLKKLFSFKFPIIHKYGKIIFKKMREYVDTPPIKQRLLQICVGDNNMFLLKNGMEPFLTFFVNLARFLPNQIPDMSKMILKSIFDFGKLPVEEKMEILPSFIYLLKILSLESYISIPEINAVFQQDFENSKSYFYNLLETLVILMQNNEIPFRGLILKYIKKIFILFPTETMNTIIFEFVDLQSAALDLLEMIIPLDTTTILLKAFLSAINNDLSLLHTISPLVFTTMRKIVLKNPNAYDDEIAMHLTITFDAFSKEFLDQMNYGLHGLMSFIQISKAYFEVLKHDMSYENIFSFSRIFAHPQVRFSIIQKKFFLLIKKHANQEFHKGLLDYSFQKLQNEDITDTYFIERLVSHLIDFINPKTEEFQDYLWSICEILKENKTYLTILLIVWLKILNMTPILYLDKLPEIIQYLPDLFTTGVPYIIILAFKIMQSLLKYELTPDAIIIRIVAFFLTYGKDFESPYAVMTMQILKNRQKLFQTIPPELEEAFLFFCTDKIPFLKDINKIVYAVQAIPKLLDVLPFPLVPALLNIFWRKLKEQGDDTIFDNSLENALTCLLKLALHSQLTDEELGALYSLSFKFVKSCIMNKVENKPKDFFDILCNLINKLGCQKFDLEILDLIFSSTAKEKYYFTLLAAAAKVVDDSIILQYKECYIDQIRSITAEYNKGQILLLLIRLVNSQELFDVFIPEINALIDNLKGNLSNELNIELIGLIIQTIIKSNLEFDKFNYIVQLWQFMDTVTDYSPLKQFYRLMANIFDEITEHKYQSLQLNLMLEHSLKSNMRLQLMIYTSHLIIKSEKVPISLKFNLMNFVNENLVDIRIDTLERLSIIYKEFAESIQPKEEHNSSEFNLNKYILRLYIHLMLHTTYNKSVIYAEKALHIMGDTIEDRFKSALILPRTIWQNDLLGPISLLIIGKESFPAWQSLIVFSKGLENVSYCLFRNVLKQIEDKEEILIIMRDLFNELSSMPNCNSAITALLSVLNEAQASPTLLASQIYKAPFDFPIDLTNWPAESITEDLLLVNSCNEHILSIFQSDNIWSRAAEFQFFLSNYDEVLNIYSAEEADMTSPFDKKIFDFSTKLTENLFYYRTEEEKNVISSLIEGIDLIKANRIDEAKDQLDHCLSDLLLVSSQNTISTFDTDFIFSISLLINQLQNPERQITYSIYFLHPIFQSTFYKLNREMNYRLDSNSKEPLINDLEEGQPFMILPPHMANLFESIAGYDSRGFSIVSTEYIMKYSTDVIFTNPNRVIQNHFEAYQWSSLCFNIFCHLKTTILLSASFYSVIALLDHIDYLPLFAKYQASARFITLLRLALIDKRDKKAIEACENATKLLMSEKYENKTEYFYFWIRQAIELMSFAPFNKFIQNKSTEFYNVSTEYNLGKFAFEDSTNLQFKEALTRMHLNAFHSLEELFDFVFDGMDFFEFQLQRSLEKVLYLSRGVIHEPIDLMELRKQIPKDEFTDYLCELPFSIVEKLNDISLLETVKTCSADEIFELVESLIPSSHQAYKLNKHQLYNMIDELNTKMPIPVPTRASYLLSTTILMMQYDIKKINDEIFVFTFRTSLMKNTNFIVQRSQNKLSQNLCSTFSSFVFILRHISKMGSSNRIRSIRIPSYIAFDISPRYSVYSLNGKIKSLEDSFMAEFGESSSDWLKSSDVDTISDMQSTILLNMFKHNLITEDFLKQRDIFINSHSSSFFIQNLFMTKYPKLNEMVILFSTCEVPLLFSSMSMDYTEKEYSTFRLSPNILNLLGPHAKTQIMLIFASIAQCFVNFNDAFLSYLELMICDQLGTNLDLNQMLTMREKVNQVLLSISPPRSPGALPSDSAEWICYLQNLIDKACDSSIHPIEAVPWF